MLDGMICTSQADIASTMPVPVRTPVRTAAAMTMLTTATTDGAWATSCALWSLTWGKFTNRAIAEPTMKTYGRGTRSAMSMPITATVSARLNHCSFGRRVLRFGSREVPARALSRSSATGSVPSSTATEEPPTAGAAPPGLVPGRPRPAYEPPTPERPAGAPPSNVSGAPQSSGCVARRRLRSWMPSIQAKARTRAMPPRREGSIGTKTSLTSMLSAVAARAVGPPQGTMFIVPLARPATQVSTTGLIFSRR